MGILRTWRCSRLHKHRSIQNFPISFSAEKPLLVLTFWKQFYILKNVGNGCLLSRFSFHFTASKACRVPSVNTHLIIFFNDNELIMNGTLSNTEGNDHHTNTVKLTFATIGLVWYAILWLVGLIGWRTA